MAKKIAKKTKSKPKAKAKPKSLTIQVLDSKGKVSGSEPLDARIAESETHPHLLHQYERMYQANQRLGTAKVKDRSEVSGGGKKPWRQKGTGRARVGSIRSPIWTKGGVTFGPGSRKYDFQLPAQLKQRALAAGLKRKAVDAKLFMIDEFKIESGKTKACAESLERLRLKKPVIIKEDHDEPTIRSARNIQRLRVAESRDVSAHDVMASDECVLTRAGYGRLLERLSISDGPQ